MAIDASIIGGLRPPQIPALEIQTPLDRFGKVLTLQHLMQQGQMGQLELQQKQRDIQEVQALADLFSGKVPGTTATPAASVPEGATGIIDGRYYEPNLTRPAGPEGRAQPLPYQPNESGPPTAQLLPYAPNVSGPPTAQPLSGGNFGIPGFPSDAEILRASPSKGMAIIKLKNETQKARLDTHIKQLDDAKKQTEVGTGLVNGIIDNDSLKTNLVKGAQAGLISWDEARLYSDLGFDHPRTQAFLKSKQQESLTYDKLVEIGINRAKEQREALEFGDKQRDRERIEFAQRVSTLQDVKDFPALLAAQPDHVKAFYGGLTGIQNLEQLKQAVTGGAEKPEFGKTVSELPSVQAQKIETHAVQGLRAKELELALQNKDLEAVIDLVKKDPTGRLFSQLPPDIQKKATPELVRAGFTAFTKEPTTAEQRALTFYQRAKDASGVMRELESKIQDKSFLEQAVFQYGPNWMQSEANQGYRQAQRQFTEARLRKESGAAIAPSEYENDAKTYFPQPGDSKTTMAQKAKAREDILNALRVEAGNAYRQQYPESQAPAQKPSATETKPASTAPTKAAPPKPGAILPGKDGKRWMFIGGDPRDRNNYKEWHPEAQ